jgi:biopolymer transport protein ExbD
MDDKQIDTLNMIPFIDIMLVLFTIVLTTSSFIASGRIPVQLPQATSSETEADVPQTIEIDAQGLIYYGGNMVSAEQLQSQISSLKNDTAFLLRADKKVELQRFVDVADVLKQLHFKRVAVQVEASRR